MIHRTELDAAGEAAFRQDLTALIPNMRAFARTLTGNAASADDLAQEALMKAWRNRSGFQAGTNLKAWTFMILRNQFYTDRRRDWRSLPLDQEVAETTLVAVDDPSAAIEVEELRQALNHIPTTQREAIVLVGAGGLSYEDAARVCGCPIGTMKSRVSRARTALVALLETGGFARRSEPAGQAVGSLMSEVEGLQAGRA